jgi:hypothetical protein
MVLVASGEDRFCVDKYEASLIEATADGTEKPFPHWLPVAGHAVRAVSEPDVFPQGFISEIQAEEACAASGKRLCTHAEWKTACMGSAKTTFPYGEERRPGVCHDSGKSAVASVFGFQHLADPTSTPARSKPVRRPHVSVNRAAETSRARAARVLGASSGEAGKAKRAKVSTHATRPTSGGARSSSTGSVWTQLNDPRLGQVDGGLARTGSHAECVSSFGAVDMVGNLHEWVKTESSAAHGTFAGGYYLDTSLNGDGCNYKTVAHAHDYHDYSTGFRCCAEPRVERTRDDLPKVGQPAPAACKAPP